MRPFILLFPSYPLPRTPCSLFFTDWEVRYKKPDGDTSLLITERVSRDKLNATNNIRFASSVAEFGMLLRESEFKGSSSYATVLKRAKSSVGLDEYGYRADFMKMVELSEMLCK